MASISIVTVVGLALYLIVLAMQQWTKTHDAKAKKQNELRGEWDEAVKNHDTGAKLNFLNKLRRKK